MIMIPSLEGVLFFAALQMDSNGKDTTYIWFFVNLYQLLLYVVFSLFLALSSFYLTVQLKRQTKMKSNTCLLNWHIFNLLILIVIMILFSLFYFKTLSEASQNYWKFYYYGALTDLAIAFVDIYVDLFLLWLLYKFMNPQKDFDWQSDTITIRFAHDS